MPRGRWEGDPQPARNGPIKARAAPVRARPQGPNKPRRQGYARQSPPQTCQGELSPNLQGELDGFEYRRDPK